MKRFITIVAITAFFTISLQATAFAQYQDTMPTMPQNSLVTIFVDTDPSLWNNRYSWQDGTITITGSVYNTQAQFRGRGNSTWELWRNYKIPFNFRLEDPTYIAGFENAGTSFILLANHIDRSLMRNFGALFLANEMYNINFTPAVRPVNVYINGVYQGVYLLTEHRVPQRLQATYVIELMMGAYGQGEQYIDWFAANERYYLIRHSSTGTIESGIAIADFVERASAAITSRNFSEIERYFDIPALVDFYVVQELFASSDAGSFSVWMQIRDNDYGQRKIYMGPVWDFDAAAGIINHVSYLPQFENPWVHLPRGVAVAELNYWYRELVQIPEFNQLLNPRLNYLVDHALPQTLDTMWYYVNTYIDCFERNFSIHYAGPGEWSVYSLPQLQELDNFYDHVVFLENFLQTRSVWLRDFYRTGAPVLVWP